MFIPFPSKEGWKGVALHVCIFKGFFFPTPYS
jgi:hypothetical protein